MNKSISIFFGTLWFLLQLVTPVIGEAQPDAAAAGRLEITGVDTSTLPRATITANVYDRFGQPIGGLDATNFSLTGAFADVAQIDTVENIRDDNLNFATVLAIDVSDSMQGNPIENARQAARAFVETISADDQVAVLTFGSGVELVQDFTADRATLLAAIDGLRARGQTALYQGAYEAVALAANAPTPRRAVILVSDGSESGGRSTVERDEVVQAAIARGISVYTIGIGVSADRTFLLELAERTNARNFESPSGDQLVGIYTDWANRLRSQYVLTLDAEALPLDGRVMNVGLRVLMPNDVALQADTELQTPVPIPVVQILDPPTAPLTDASTIALEITADDQPVRVTYQLSDGEIFPLEEPYTITLDPLDLLPGDYTLIVRATDTDGDESAPARSSFTVAALPSTVTIDPDLSTLDPLRETQPIRLAITGQTEPVEVTYAFDRDTDDLTGDGAAEPVALDPPYEFDIDPQTLPPGPNTLTVTVTNAGGVTTPFMWDFEVEALSPEIEVVGLAANEVIDTDRTITLSIRSQTPIEDIIYLIDDVETARQQDEPYPLTLDVLDIGPGDHTLTIRAIPAHGVEGRLSLPFSVAPAPIETATMIAVETQAAITIAAATGDAQATADQQATLTAQRTPTFTPSATPTPSDTPTPTDTPT
ncbi:MAG: VWA domain-containing protein, partial [Chloroflexi bacterium]|nr:VWA domain-containing protein [Chloroflexota bacterium]